MTASSSLGRQIAEVTEALGNAGIPCALIGGLALASYQVVRATQDARQRLLELTPGSYTGLAESMARKK